MVCNHLDLPLHGGLGIAGTRRLEFRHLTNGDRLILYGEEQLGPEEHREGDGVGRGRALRVRVGGAEPSAIEVPQILFSDRIGNDLSKIEVVFRIIRTSTCGERLAPVERGLPDHSGRRVAGRLGPEDRRFVILGRPVRGLDGYHRFAQGGRLGNWWHRSYREGRQ